MKTNLLLFLLLSAATLTTTRAQTTQNGGPDEAVIRKTLNDMRTAFDKRDLNGFASYFVNSPDLYYQVSTVDKLVILAHGIDNMKKMVGGYFQSNPTSTAPGSYKSTDLLVRVKNNIAYVTGGGEEGTERSRDFIVLEKTGANWKVSALTSQNYETGKLIVVK